VRPWERELLTPASELGIDVTVGHLSPGTSKWNKIEYRLFSFITRTGVPRRRYIFIYLPD
jgi:Rhodopirellula transposase DDE domain